MIDPDLTRLFHQLEMRMTALEAAILAKASNYEDDIGDPRPKNFIMFLRKHTLRVIPPDPNNVRQRFVIIDSARSIESFFEHRHEIFQLQQGAKSIVSSPAPNGKHYTVLVKVIPMTDFGWYVLNEDYNPYLDPLRIEDLETKEESDKNWTPPQKSIDCLQNFAKDVGR